MTILRLLAALTVAILAAAAVRAQDAAPPVDPSAVEAFVDGVVEAYGADDGIAGVTVAVVSRDGVLMQKGYGLAAVGPDQPVDPNKTLFRIASISKTFTYILAMQLVDEGKLKLDAPADDYLPDALKFAGDGFPVPKVLDLMQHTAGFEDSALGHLFTRQPGPALEDYLTRYRPRRVRPPGAKSVYSNYSVALLGEIIARLDGRLFEEAVQARLLSPLGLTGVTFNDVSALSSTGFEREGGWFTPQPTFYVAQVGPAAEASASAAGMARYMRMLLNGGSLDGVSVLSPRRFAEMAAPSFRNAPEVTALAHGFLNRAYGGLDSLEHDGAALYFYSNMVVWPKAGLGLFVAANTDTGASLTAALPRLFIEHFVPTARPTEPKALEMPLDMTASLGGFYAIDRRNMSTFEGFLQRVVQDASVRVRGDGGVVVTTPFGTVRYVLEAPDVLRAVETGARVRVLRTEEGDIDGFAATSGVNGAQRLGFFDTPLVLAATIGIVLFTSAWCLVAFAVRLRYRAGTGQSWSERSASALQAIAALLWLAATFTLAAAALPMAADQAAAVFDYPGPLMPIARALLHAAAAASLLTLPMLAVIWRGPTWCLRRVTFTLYALTAGFAAILLWRWGALLTPIGIGPMTAS